MEVLVHEKSFGTVDGAVHVDRRVEQPALERRGGDCVSAWYVVGPAVGFVREEHEGLLAFDLDLQPRKELRDDADLVGLRIPEPRPGNAALEEQRTTRVVTGMEKHGTASSPALERVRLVLGLGVRGRVELEHELAGRDHE